MDAIEDGFTKLKAGWIVGPIVAMALGAIGLFWQVNNMSNTFLTLREHLEYEASMRREVDAAKIASERELTAAKTSADKQVAEFQRQMDNAISSLRSDMKEKFAEIQGEIDASKKERR